MLIFREFSHILTLNPQIFQIHIILLHVFVNQAHILTAQDVCSVLFGGLILRLQVALFPGLQVFYKKDGEGEEPYHMICSTDSIM